MLPRHLRLTHPREYAQLYRVGRQIGSSYFRLFYSLTDQNFSRFGFVISKKQVKKIVTRNRLKRILRAATRLWWPRFPQGTMVVVQVKPLILKLTPQQVREEFGAILTKARLLKE